MLEVCCGIRLLSLLGALLAATPKLPLADGTAPHDGHNQTTGSTVTQDEAQAPAAAPAVGAGGALAPLLRRGGSGRLADVVAKLYYINIDTASARRVYMEEMLTKVGKAARVSHERFSAVTREDPWVQAIMQDEDFQDSFLFKEKEELVASGTLATYASHLNLMQHIAKVNENVQLDGSHPQWALVLEDDAHINLNDLELLPQLVKNVPEDAEVIKLGMWGNARDEDQVSPGIYRVAPPSTAPKSNGTTMFFYMGAHGYLVRLNKMNRLVEGFESCAADNNYWADACLMYGLVSYQIKPDIVGMQEFESQIDNSF